MNLARAILLFTFSGALVLGMFHVLRTTRTQTAQEVTNLSTVTAYKVEKMKMELTEKEQQLEVRRSERLKASDSEALNMVEKKAQDTSELEVQVLELNRQLAEYRENKNQWLGVEHKLDVRTKEVADAQMMIDQKEDSIARCRHDSAIAMAATEQELENTRGEIQGLEEDITELRKLITVREGWVRERDAIIKKKDSTILELQQESIEKSKALDWLQQRFANKIQEIKDGQRRPSSLPPVGTNGYTPAGIPCIPDTAQSTVIKRKGAIIPDVGDMTEIRQATPSGIDSRLREPDPRPSRKAMRG